jgi:CBS domain-containing protein
VSAPIPDYSKDELFEILKATKPFSFLEDQAITLIIDQATIKSYTKGSFIFREGDPSKQILYFILDGKATALARLGSEESVTTVRSKGDFFGVTVLLSDEAYPVSMVAADDLTCLLISQKNFQQTLAGNSHFADFFTKTLAARLKDLYLTFADSRYEEQFFQGQSLRRRVADIARDQVVTCLPMDKISDVAKKMHKNRISSVVVVAFNGKPVGIITEKDLVHKVLSTDQPDLNRRAHEIMSSDLITVKPDDFSYRALLMMTKYNIKHIVITDDNDVLHGIITVKDLIRNRNSGALSIIRQIEYQDSFDGLAGLIREIDQVQQALLTERAFASEICSLLSELYDRITRRVIQIAEAQMSSEGRGKPPVEYCFITMGSAGRKEQFSRTDQDHGIIYADLNHEEQNEAADYFLNLGQKIVSGMEMCGFSRCSGFVMADNPQWCRPLSGWKNMLSSWTATLDPRDIRNMTIFLDYRHLYGESALCEHLKDYSTRLFKDSKHALLFMAEDDLKHRVPLNIFGNIISRRTSSKKRRVNLKAEVMVHLVDCIRLFTLREGIRDTNSFDRIHSLKARGVFKADDAEFIEAAFESLLMFRIRNSLDRLRDGHTPDNVIDLSQLNKKERILLKEAMLVVNRLQTLTDHSFYVHKA